MARDSAQERRDNLNRGIPKHSGLDEGTKASLQRALGDRDGGIKVGSFRDLQVGLTDIPVADRPANPSVDESDVVPITEHMAAEAAVLGTDATGVTTYDDTYTVEELKDALADRGLPTSGTKQELLDRLNG